MAEDSGMETPSTYFTRRARQERTSAVEADSAEARSAHLELAFRLVKVATEPALFGGWREFPHGHNDNVAGPLHAAFPVPADDDFRQLLEAVDRNDRG